MRESSGFKFRLTRIYRVPVMSLKQEEKVQLQEENSTNIFEVNSYIS